MFRSPNRLLLLCSFSNILQQDQPRIKQTENSRAQDRKRLRAFQGLTLLGVDGLNSNTDQCISPKKRESQKFVSIEVCLVCDQGNEGDCDGVDHDYDYNNDNYRLIYDG